MVKGFIFSSHFDDSLTSGQRKIKESLDQLINETKLMDSFKPLEGFSKEDLAGFLEKRGTYEAPEISKEVIGHFLDPHSPLKYESKKHSAFKSHSASTETNKDQPQTQTDDVW